MTPIAANEQASYRYPGVTPFTTEQAPVFFGRKEDTEDLYRLIRREPLVVLYGKSGLGKSSLLNAGIIPRCTAEGSYNSLVIRFGAWVEGTTTTPLDITKTALTIGYEQATFLDRLLPEDTSLWYYAKRRQLVTGDLTNFQNLSNLPTASRPLLLFDQFEELFSYPAEQVKAFEEELSELLNTSIPLRFQRMAEASDTLSEEEEDLLETPLEARIIFAIRSDRMHLLDRLKDYLPNVLRHCFELQALNRKDAEEAILLPAQAIGNFITVPFNYSPDALQKLLDFLTDSQDGRIEGILLQMLCEHYERQLVEKQGLTKLTTNEVGYPDEVVEKYYEEKINILPESQRLPARKLIEDGLVSEGEAMRLSLHESYILHEFGVDKVLLERMVDSRLLRSEPFLRGGYTFELSHDRLVSPVLNSRSLRQKIEAKEKAEKQRLELEKTRKRLRTLRGLLVVSVVALLALLIAGWQFFEANAARTRAQQNQQEAIKQKDFANQKTKLAEDALKKVIKTRKEKIINQIKLDEAAGFYLSAERRRRLLLKMDSLEKVKASPDVILNELED